MTVLPVEIHVLTNIFHAQYFKIKVFIKDKAVDIIVAVVFCELPCKDNHSDHLDLFFDLLLTNTDAQIFIIMTHNGAQYLYLFVLVSLKIEVDPQPLSIVRVIKHDELPPLVHNEYTLVLYIGAYRPTKVAVVHFHLEVVVHFSLVRSEIVLVLLERHTEFLRLNKQHHAASHEVHHHVLQLWDPILFI